MDTALECMPCFMKMAVNEAKLACPDDPVMQHAIVSAWGARLSSLDLQQPPPAIARHLAQLVREISGCGDLYTRDKQEANEWVLSLLPELKERLSREAELSDGDPLALALELSIIGNYIDRGVEIDFDLEKEIADVAGGMPSGVFDQLKMAAVPGANILILGDNTGEIVLDMLLVEELKRRGCTVTHAVRSSHVLNDATMEDAEAVGMTALCQVVESGVDTPGNVLDRCTPEFLNRMHDADVILSKGQGNFEALIGNWPGVFCAFKVKCKRVAGDTGLTLGSSAFCRLVDGGLIHD